MSTPHSSQTPRAAFSGPIRVSNAGIFNGSTKATLRDDAGLVAEVYTYGNNEADIDHVKLRAAILAAAPELLAMAQLALSRADCELRMWPLKEEGNVEYQSLTTFANKLRAVIARATSAP